MKLILFKSKTCGPCKMFEPQVKGASETLGVETITVDVEENVEFDVFGGSSTQDLIRKFGIESSGTLVFVLDENNPESPVVIFNRPCPAYQIVSGVNNMINASK